MKGRNKIANILKDTSGASFMFVLGIMLLLMAIGVSTLVAASANTGFALKQKEHSQIMILDDSIHKNIMYSLQHEPSDPNLLSKQLVMAIYEAANGDSMTKDLIENGIELDLAIAGVDLVSGNIRKERIMLSFPMKVEEMVIITEAVEEMTYVIDATPYVIDREPRTARINAEMIVTVEIEAVAQKKTVTSRATYKYTGGVLSDDPTGTGVAASTMDFAVDARGDAMSGKWELVKYENMD